MIICIELFQNWLEYTYTLQLYTNNSKLFMKIVKLFTENSYLLHSYFIFGYKWNKLVVFVTHSETGVLFMVPNSTAAVCMSRELNPTHSKVSK